MNISSWMVSRVVKGGRLKLYCESFVGSSPTPSIYCAMHAWFSNIIHPKWNIKYFILDGFPSGQRG